MSIQLLTSNKNLEISIDMLIILLQIWIFHRKPLRLSNIVHYIQWRLPRRHIPTNTMSFKYLERQLGD